MKRKGNLYEQLLSDENLMLALIETNRGHRWRHGHKPNKTVRAVEAHMAEAVVELRRIIEAGFVPAPLKVRERWDRSAQKMRMIAEPKLWPDQYVHHALVQVLQPIILRGMDHWCCGSVKRRGIKRGKAGIEKWVRNDIKGTRYASELDIRRFYDSLDPTVVFTALKRKVKDHRFLDFVWRVIERGFVAGTYFAQWFANFTLAGLDRLIRTFKGVHHYVRYMDNMTIFGPAKRPLHKLRKLIAAWLERHRLQLKQDWQVYHTAHRQPRAMGYRYGRKGTRLRKRNKLRIRRAVAEVMHRRRHHKKVTARRASGLLSRLGQLTHCRAVTFRAQYVPKKLQKWLKAIVRKEQKTWSMSLETTC